MSSRRRAAVSASSESWAWSRAAGAWSARRACGTGRGARPQPGTLPSRATQHFARPLPAR
eukprot:2977104-Pyramimonas_sp.AAC.1